ncbi:MAG: radical SAM protein [Candidatus Omnitrophota bacterium]
MKILLINPNIDARTGQRLGPVARSLFYNSPPLGLCYIAAVLEREGHDVAVIDAAVEDLNAERLLKRVRACQPDIVGITTFTVSAYSARDIAAEIKRALPGAKIVFGGPHINSNMDDFAGNRAVDIVILGEGEVTFKELADAVGDGKSLEGVPGIAYKSGNSIIRTAPREYIKDLDILPFPARHLIPIKKYKPQPNDQRALPKMSVISSRGCPYSCIFCYKNIFGSKYRSFSPAYIVREIQHLVREYGARDIAFVDSLFTPDKQRVRDIIREMRKANLNVSWTCAIRADIVDRDLLKEMKEAGCWRVRIGAESGSDEVLKFIRKGMTTAEIGSAVRWAHEVRLSPKAFFMIGHCTDTEKTVRETIDFALRIPLDDITVQLNTPLPGTYQYGLCRDYGLMVSDDLSEFSFWEPVFVPKGLSGKFMMRAWRDFYKRFYLRPSVWFGHLRRIRGVPDIVRYVKALALLMYLFFGSFLIKRGRGND